MRPGDASATDSGQADIPASDSAMADTGPDFDAGPTPDVPGVDTGPGTDGGPGMDGGPAPTDAGTDAFDAGNDAGPPPDVPPDVFDAGCSGDAECDNGNACDGEEACVAGMCEAGTPVVCNDGVSCTVDSCVPATGMCQSTPNNSMCASPQICTATGCISPGCGETPCRLVSPQCGCPDGNSCYITGMDERVCAPSGTASTGESCNGSEICEGGNVCIDLDGAGTITMCRGFCDTDADCSGGVGALCLVTVTGTTQNICTTHCDPATNVGCPADTGCSLFTDPMGRRLSDCDVTGSATQGQTCTERADCATGFDCFTTAAGPPAVMQCLRTCRRASPVGNECSAHAGTTCIPLSEPLIFNGTEYGACL